MHRASRYRLHPNRTQERQFARLCGAGRFVYNELLAGQIREYGRFEAGEAEKPGCSGFDFGKRYVRLKAQEGNEWLRELSAPVVRGTGAFPLGAAFAHFSRRIREDFSHQASADLARLFGHLVLEELDVQAMRRSARGTKEKPGRCVKAKAALNRKMAQSSCMGMVDRFLQYKAWDIIKVPARNTSRACAECGHVDADNRKEQALQVPGLRAHRQRGRECRTEHPEPGIEQALGRRRSGDGTGRGQRSGSILHGMPGGHRQ